MALTVILGFGRKLIVLLSEESEIIENKDHDEWLQELAMNNTTLESLNLYLTEVNVRVDGLLLLAIFYTQLGVCEDC